MMYMLLPDFNGCLHIRLALVVESFIALGKHCFISFNSQSLKKTLIHFPSSELRSNQFLDSLVQKIKELLKAK